MTDREKIAKLAAQIEHQLHILRIFALSNSQGTPRSYKYNEIWDHYNRGERQVKELLDIIKENTLIRVQIS